MGDRDRPSPRARRRGRPVGGRARSCRRRDLPTWAFRSDRRGRRPRRRRSRPRSTTCARPSCSICPTSRCSATASGWSSRPWRSRGGSPTSEPTSASIRRPAVPRARRVPTLAVIGTGKRTGKTAIRGELARLAARAGPGPDGRRDGPRRSCRAAGGRGGSVDLDAPARPRSVPGEHAASDYLEDALTTGVTTIGARRAGGGLAGAPYVTQRPRGGGARRAAGRPGS